MSEKNFPEIKMSKTELSRLIDDFIDNCSDKSRQTRLTYMRALNEFVRFFNRDKKFLFAVSDVKRYIRYLKNRKQMKDYSLITYLTALRRFFRYLVGRGVLKTNPAKKIKIKIREKSDKISYLTENELVELINNLGSDSIADTRDSAIISLMVVCALSEQEISSLNIENIIIDNNIFLEIPGQKEKTEVNAPASSVLQKYISSIDNETGDNPLFYSFSNRSKYERISIRGVREIIKQRLKDHFSEQSEKKITPYILHHSAGIMMAASGKSVEDIKKRFNIKVDKIAEQYFNFVEDFKAKVV